MARSTPPNLWKTTRQLQEGSRILREGLRKHSGESKSTAIKASKLLSHRSGPQHRTKS